MLIDVISQEDIAKPQPKKSSPKVPIPQQVPSRPKRTCRKSVFTTSPYVIETKKKRNEDEIPGGNNSVHNTDNTDDDPLSQPSFDLGI